TPLSVGERADVMRAAIGYALAEDTIRLERFRAKYAPKMADGPDGRAFEVVTQPFNAGTPEFSEIAKSVAACDTLEAFLRDIRTRRARFRAGRRRGRPRQPNPRCPSAALPRRRGAPASACSGASLAIRDAIGSGAGAPVNEPFHATRGSAADRRNGALSNC